MLGAVIVSAMLNLVNIPDFFHALCIARISGYIMIFTFACTLFLSLEDGLVYGVAASLALLLYQLSNVRASFCLFIVAFFLCIGLGFDLNLTCIPLLCEQVDAVVLGQERGPNGELHLVSLRDNPRAVPCDPKDSVIVLHPVASLFFGNAEILRDDVRVETMEALLCWLIDSTPLPHPCTLIHPCTD